MTKTTVIPSVGPTIGIDIGATKLLACLVDANGDILARSIQPTGRSAGPEIIEQRIDTALKALVPFDDIIALGIGFPGLVEFPRGLVRSTVMLDGWRNVPLGKRLADRFGAPCVVDNDANAAAVAELYVRRRGQIEPDPGRENMLFIAIGTGIGGAVVLNGCLWRGVSGVAGEIGNTTIDFNGPVCWCGRRGCLNTFASGFVISARSADGPTGAAGIPPAVEEAAEKLGIGIANALNLLNFGLVVLGGGVAQWGAPFLDRVAARARAEAFPEAATACRFELALAGYEAGALGAALLARSECNPINSTSRIP